MKNQELRERAAIAALPKCIETVEKVLLHGGKIDGVSITAAAAELACEYADALVEKLKKGE